MSVEEKITRLKVKLSNQITNNDNYEDLCETSIAIDKLIVEYYKKYGLRGTK